MTERLHRTRRATLAVVTGGAVAAIGLARPSILRAATYPTRPITVVVPFSTGGVNDLLVRAFSPFLQEALGQPIVVQNRPGAGTMLGCSYFLQQPDDGHTLMCLVATYIPLAILLQNAPYKPEDFWMLNHYSSDYTLASTAAASQITSMDEVLAALREDPKSISLGVQTASVDLLNLSLLMNAFGIDRTKLRIVTYDGGGAVRNAVIGGHVDVGLVAGEGFGALKEKIRALLAFTAERPSDYPDALSAVELGRKNGVTIESVPGAQRFWLAQRSFMDKHPDRYQTLIAALEKATNNPEAIKTLAAQQLAQHWKGPAESNKAFLDMVELIRRSVPLIKS